jgi:hypothetical protein
MYYNGDAQVKGNNGRLGILAITTVAAIMVVEKV